MERSALEKTSSRIGSGSGGPFSPAAGEARGATARSDMLRRLVMRSGLVSIGFLRHGQRQPAPPPPPIPQSPPVYIFQNWAEKTASGKMSEGALNRTLQRIAVDRTRT